MAKKDTPDALKFENIAQVEVPHGRNGKHKQIVTDLLEQMALLGKGRALKVRLTQLPDTKENIRSALNRATRQRGLNFATATDANYLYIWSSDEEKAK